MTNLLRFELYTGLLAIFAAILIGILVVRFSLAPIEKIRRASRAVTSGDLDQRLSVSNPKTEIGELQTDFNNMVARIQEEFYLRSISEQRLREFLSDASHELRTPLTFILGYADLLSKDSHSQDPSIEKIKEQASRMSKLIEELLVLARLDEGQRLQLEPIDMRLLAHELAADVMLLDSTRNVKVDANEPVMVMGDSVKLRQVVTNFASNIFNHTEKGIPITVGVAASDGFGIFPVADYGKGVTDLNKIFDRFYRENKVQPDSNSTSGSGLGLSIVYAIVQAHSGKIVARPTEGEKGLTLEVQIPLIEN
jgi:two-component system OmpR family sensor kinase